MMRIRQNTPIASAISKMGSLSALNGGKLMQNKFWIVIGALVLLVPLVAAQSATGMKFRGGATLTVTFLSQDPDPVEPGSYVDLRWKVENLGTQELQDVQFVLDVDYPFSLN